MRLLAGHNLAARGILLRGHALLGDGVSAVGASVTGLTNNPTHGLTAQIGVALTGAISGLSGGEVIVHRWTADGTAISGASTANYTPVAGDDLKALRYAPLVDGAPVQSAAYTVRYAIPIAGALVAVEEIQGNGEPVVNLAAGFTGDDLTYSESVAWSSIAGSALTISDALRDDTVTITATNSGGSATVDLSVRIEDFLTITDSGTSQAVLTLSNIPADADLVPATTIIIDGVTHSLPAGTTAGDLRSSAVQMERDSPALTSTGDPAAFAEGDVLTLADTIWLSTDMLSFSVVVSNSGGVVQSGTDRSYTVTAADVADGTLSLREVANNGSTNFDGETLISTAAVASGADLAALFGNGEEGVVIMPGTAHTICYTEITGAAASTVCGDGDPVGTIHDTVNGHYLVAPSTANRADYNQNNNRAFFSKTTGARYYVSTAPVDMSATDRASAVLGVERPDDTTFRYIAGLGNNTTDGGVNFSKSSTARRYLAYANGAGGDTAKAAGTGSTPGTSSGSLPNVDVADVVRMQVDLSGNLITIWANGDEYENETADVGGGNLANANINFLADPDAASNGFIDNVYGYVLINRHLTAQEATALEAGMQDQIVGV
ncbi:hypothetical protein [Roseobacter sp. S98]|uniref:hypothetical protein n=1 Tax=Roseobacter algicola (ex Choi et al. 2025) (nom. illeg.) TaxID=3092138 RepID=UPI0035C75663